jgi:hypothetical protein
MPRPSHPPCFDHPNNTGQKVKKFLMPVLEEEDSNDMLFQQDRAPPHFHKEVTDFVNHKFPEKWIGRGGPISWPPRSPDLTPLDFFIFGGTSRMLCVTIGYHFAGTCWEDRRCSGYSYPLLA